jgi:hypothetical protein
MTLNNDSNTDFRQVKDSEKLCQRFNGIKAKYSIKNTEFAIAYTHAVLPQSS